MRYQELFHRYEKNPILTVDDWTYPANSVFNPGAAKFGDYTILLARVEDHRGHSHLTVARSKSGFDGWEIDSKPTIISEPEIFPEEIWGIEDPRITYIEEYKTWVVVYTAYSTAGPLVSIATTADFKSFKKIGPILSPEDKDAALFPVRFKGEWVILHRPSCTLSGVESHISLSRSPDLKHWGDHQALIRARRGGWWDSHKIGLSPPPLRTKEGWLILYHGVRKTVSGSIYRLGLALLDLEDPSRILSRSEEWVMGPKEDYEIKGDVHNVIFPGGWIEENGEIRLYYGCADTCIAVATAKTSELLDHLHNSEK